MTNIELKEWMTKLETKIDKLQKEVHELTKGLSDRITPIETVYKFVGYVISIFGISGIIAFIVFILKQLKFLP